MMSLEEFCYRAAKLKIDKKYKNDNLSPQSLVSQSVVLIVDFETQKIFISTKILKTATNLSEPKIAENIDSENNLKKNSETTLSTNFEFIDLKEMPKILQDADGKTDFDPQKLIPILKIQELQKNEKNEKLDKENESNELETEEIDNVLETVLETTFLLYPQKCENLVEYLVVYSVENESENYRISRKWVDLDTIISQNEFLNYPLWSDFCKVQNLPCFEPNLTILTQFLAHNLDKNRVAKLSEVG